MIGTTEENFCWMLSSLMALVDMIEIQNTEAYSILDLTNIKYSIYKQSRDENLKIVEPIKPNNLMHSENKKSI